MYICTNYDAKHFYLNHVACFIICETCGREKQKVFQKNQKNES